MTSVFIAGATGYLGRHLCKEYSSRGWNVQALVRNTEKAAEIEADEFIEAQATEPETLNGIMTGSDLVISALGITRQADGLTYRDVDYQANVNLLQEASRAGVKRFVYIHVLNADDMEKVPLVAAKSAFVEELQKSDVPATVIAPSGYFSDMADFVEMAKAGRIWLFGNGEKKINPIHGADLAAATADAIEAETKWLDVGGPNTFEQVELARMAFDIVGAPVKITLLPDWVRRAVLVILPYITPIRIHGPVQFFLTAMALDMVGKPHGSHSLRTYFTSLYSDDSVKR